ncbi:MAG: ferrous iron transport protein A [Planctomycetes bacterium]|nr:ferrous iron transport protein A [Planctomycetota bacterium]
MTTSTAIPTPGLLPTGSGPVPLSSLPRNTLGRIDLGDLDPSDASLAAAMGLTPSSLVRLARRGRSCIVEIRGVLEDTISTRIGVGRSLAERIRVWPS